MAFGSPGIPAKIVRDGNSWKGPPRSERTLSEESQRCVQTLQMGSKARWLRSPGRAKSPQLPPVNPGPEIASPDEVSGRRDWPITPRLGNLLKNPQVSRAHLSFEDFPKIPIFRETNASQPKTPAREKVLVSRRRLYCLAKGGFFSVITGHFLDISRLISM